MENSCGIYLSELSNGKIKRDLVSKTGKVSLEETTIQEEILLFSELDFEPYKKTADALTVLSVYLNADTEGLNDEAIEKIFSAVACLAEELAKTYGEYAPALGALLQMELDALAPQDSANLQQAHNACVGIQTVLSDTMFFQNVVCWMLYDLCGGGHLDFDNKFAPIRQFEETRILTMDEGSDAQYVFRSAVSYYQFLFRRLIQTDLKIVQCRLCRHFFIPSRKGTLYCDRVIDRGKTCKQIGPAIMRELEAEGTIEEDFNRANRRMYKRYERALDINKKPSDKDLTYDEYRAWLDRATKAKLDCANGIITEKEALEIIDVP